MYFNALYYKICIALLCLVFADLVTFGYVDYKYVIKWNLKNALLSLVFVDLVTYNNR